MSHENHNYEGVTTGSIATACSFAALKMILDNQHVDCVTIETPKKLLDIIIDDCELKSSNCAIASSHKFPYNDPDVTVGLVIQAKVELVDYCGEDVVINGGEGIGIITKPGLQIEVGDYAINPIPRLMIRKNLERLLPEGKTAKVSISIPKGQEIAQKTINPKLGIEGGISILGTTGIARSMSSKAYKDSIVKQLDVAIATGSKNLVFVPGNIGEKLAKKDFGIEDNRIIQTGNYVGFMFEEAKKRGINKFTFFGHIGKLIKIAGGIFNTKHAVADGRKEIMITHAAICGASTEVCRELYDSKTTEDMLDILDKCQLSLKVCNSIAYAISERCKVKFDLEVNVILVDMKGNFLNNNYITL